MIRINFNNLFKGKGIATPEEKARIFELKKKSEDLEKELKEKEANLSTGLDTLSPEEKVEHMREMIELQNQKRESNMARLDLERNIREGKNSQQNKKEEKKTKTPEEKIEEFLNQYNLKDKMVLDFEDLSIGQKMFVIENTKKRIVDIVKDDAETQYSVYFKEKMRATNKETKWLHQEIAKTIKVGKTGLKESMLKEAKLKDLESEAFKALIYGKGGEDLLKNNLGIIVNNAKEQEIAYDNEEGKTKIYYESYSREDGQEYTIEERQVIVDFNRAANEFRNIPYEWGQENKVGLGKNKNKKKYEEIKTSYEQAKIELLKLKSSKEDPNKKGGAMLEVAQIDSRIQMEQLLNTHPEFEKEIQTLERESGWREGIKDLKNFTNNLTGKNMANRLFLAIGYTARGLSKGALAASNLSGFTFGSSLIVGGALGYFRGKLKGKENLEASKKAARHGKARKELLKGVQATDSVVLYEKLNQLINQIEISGTKEEREKYVSMLSVRTEHTQGKIENGQVNFGNSKTALENQFKLITALNKAVVLKSAEDNNKELKTRLNRLLSHTGERVSKERNKAQKEFIKEQASRGMLIGAVGTTIGYGIRYLGENLGWWGHGGGKHLTEDSPTGPIPETKPEEVKIVPPVIPAEEVKIEETVPQNTTEDVVKDNHGEGIHRFQQPKEGPKIEKVEEEIVPKEKEVEQVKVEEKIEKVADKEADPTSKVQGSKIVWTEGESGSQNNIKDPTQSVQGSNIEWTEGKSGSAENIKDRTQVIQGSNIRRGYMDIESGEDAPVAKPEETPTTEEKPHIEEGPKEDPSTSTKEEDYREPTTENGNKMGPPTEEEYMEPTTGKSAPVEEKLTEKIEGSPKVVAQEPQPEEYREPVSEVDYKEGRIPEEEYEEPVTKNTTEDAIKNIEPKTKEPNIESEYGEPGQDTLPTSENPYGLSETQLQEVKTFNNENLSKVFGEKMNIWENIKNNPASSEITSEGITDEKKAFIKYLKKLRDVTGLEPRRETIVSRAETNSEYIKRALEYAIKQNKLSQLKL